MLFSATGLQATVASDPQVTVREESGVYVVMATFGVSQPASTAFAVLTDYEQIPRFMPDIRSSHVLERSEQQAVIEQEAVARFMMFSKRVHLVLEVQEHGGTIRFRDRCGQSFVRYEGGWTITEQDGRTAIKYELTAQPAFDVPEFLLKRLLKRDAAQMIERLQAAIAERARSLQE
jgi:ribosome-associated toxin RatA of RatAB toxin-antitoxin module